MDQSREFPQRRRLRRVAAGVVPILLAGLAGCAGAPRLGDPPDGREILDRGLPVARAALATGQFDTAQRLYRALAEQVDPAPEPHLGLGRIHSAAGDWQSALSAFVSAEARSRDRPDLLLEARIGIARARLFGGVRAVDEAGDEGLVHGWEAAGKTLERALRDAEGLDPPLRRLGAAWGLMAVVRDHAGDRQGAGQAMRKALAVSPADPALWANAVALRARNGELAQARSLLASRPEGFWLPGDRRRLERLIGTPVSARPPPALRLGPSGGTTGTLPAPAGPEAGPFTPRLRWLGLPEVPRPAPSSPAPVRLALGGTRAVTLAEDATSVVVVREEVADVHLTAPDTLYLVARGPGQTQIAIDLEGGERVHTTLTVVQDAAPVQAVLDTLDEAKHLKAVGLPYAISIRGVVPSPETAQWVLQRVAGAVPEGVALDDGMQLEGPLQVELEVQIAEIQRNVSERLGINWAASRLDKGGGGLRIGTPFPGTTTGTFTDNLFNATSALDVTGYTNLGSVRFDFLIQALATAGLANVLAQPTLTALSGEEASFHAGGEIPVLSGEKDDRLEYTYRELGVILGFIPTVLSEDRIGISVRAEVKEEDQSRTTDRSLPFLTARKARTTVEIGNGESFIIAGLFSTSSDRSESGVPLLKDVPAVGLLFGQTLTSAEERELIIAVTARLVHPDEVPEEGEASPPRSRMVNGYYV